MFITSNAKVLIVFHNSFYSEHIYSPISRLKKIVLAIFIPLILFFAACVALVKIPAVQSWLVNRISSILSADLNATVSINAVDFRLFRSIKINGLFIEDQKHDTLLYAEEMDAAISLFSFRKQKLVIGDVTLKEAHIYLKRYKDVNGLNFDFLIDYFSSPASSDTTKGWDIKLNRLKLSNALFSYHDYRWSDTTSCIDFEDMYVSGLDLEADNFKTLNDSIQFDLISLKANEKSGFQLQNLSGLFSIGSDHLSAKKMSVKTRESNVNGDVRLSFKDWDDFNDFIPKVKMSSSFQKSSIASEDLKYFTEKLVGLKKTVTFQGDIHGTIDNLKGKKLQIIYTPGCFFKGDLSMRGLPDIDATFIDMMANELRLNKSDIESIPVYPFINGEKLNLPDNMDALGTVQFKGKFTGFYNDFVAYGTATTALGYVSSDINFKIQFIIFIFYQIGTIDSYVFFSSPRYKAIDLDSFFGSVPS